MKCLFGLSAAAAACVQQRACRSARAARHLQRSRAAANVYEQPHVREHCAASQHDLNNGHVVLSSILLKMHATYVLVIQKMFQVVRYSFKKRHAMPFFLKNASLYRITLKYLLVDLFGCSIKSPFSPEWKRVRLFSDTSSPFSFPFWLCVVPCEEVASEKGLVKPYKLSSRLFHLFIKE